MEKGEEKGERVEAKEGKRQDKAAEKGDRKGPLVLSKEDVRHVVVCQRVGRGWLGRREGRRRAEGKRDLREKVLALCQELMVVDAACIEYEWEMRALERMLKEGWQGMVKPQGGQGQGKGERRAV